MLMSAHNGAVDHRIFVVGVGREMLKQPLPDTAFGPTAEPQVDLYPVAEPLRQIAPRHPGTITVQHRLHEPPIVRRGHPDRAFASRQQVLDPVPLIVAQSSYSTLNIGPYLINGTTIDIDLRVRNTAILFKSDPAHYAPQFGNACTTTLSRGGFKEVDPQAWVIHEDKLYMFGGIAGVPMFAKDPAGYITKANQNRSVIPKS